MESSSKKILIAYFSHSGNTREVARQIQSCVGGDLFEIVSVEPYPRNYNAVVEQARKELEADHRPQLKARLKDAASYETVFIGFPNWWNTFPTPVGTFLRETDLSGKTIAPFCTHEGSGLGRSVSDVTKLCAHSKVLPGLALRGSSVKRAGDEISKWIGKLELPSTRKHVDKRG
jgi:flavodoxin